jgi:hypothetical protein
LRGSESAAYHSGATVSAFGAGGGATVDIAGIIKRFVQTVPTSRRRQVTPAWMEMELRTAGVPGQ